MTRNTRPISWIRSALKEFEKFPGEARGRALIALTVVAEGGKPDIAKPLSGLGSGVWELAIRARGDAWRVIYALQVDDDIWVVHAFQKKSKHGIATPKMELDLVKERLRRLREELSRNAR
jgi:phage-related protein